MTLNEILESIQGKTVLWARTGFLWEEDKPEDIEINFDDGSVLTISGRYDHNRNEEYVTIDLEPYQELMPSEYDHPELKR